MKKFFKEFKEFITRGNVLDMAVGIIVGGAFTAIVNSLVKNILTPLINWIPGADGTSALQVVLRDAVYAEDNVTVIKEALVIDFGAVISAIITFLITAFVLFLIIKTVNHIHAKSEKIKEEYRKKNKKAEVEAVEAVEEAAEEVKAAEEVAEQLASAPAPTTEELLAEILDLLKANNK